MTHYSEYNPRAARTGSSANLTGDGASTVKSTIMIGFIGAILVVCMLISLLHALRGLSGDDTSNNDDDASTEARKKSSRKYNYRRVMLRKEHFHQRKGRMEDTTESSTAHKTTNNESAAPFAPDEQQVEVESDIESATERARNCSIGDDDSPSVGTKDTEDCFDWEDTDGGHDAENQTNVLTLRFGKHTKEFQNVCAICLGSYEVGETVVWSTNLTCTHAFHEECVRPVFERGSTKCPLCRADFVDLEDGVA